MGKKSRAKRERRDGIASPASGMSIADFLFDALKQDDPNSLRIIAAIHGRPWLLLDGLPGGKMPFAFAASGAKKARCLAAYIDIAAQEVGLRVTEEKPSDETKRIIERLSEGVVGLSLLAMAFNADQEPLPTKEIRQAISSLFDHLPDELLDLQEPTISPLIHDDWAYLKRERAALAERPDIEKAIGDAGLPKDGEPPPPRNLRGIDD
jgi:hypothetical protein